MWIEKWVISLFIQTIKLPFASSVQNLNHWRLNLDFWIRTHYIQGSFYFPKHFLLLLHENAWLVKEDSNQSLKKHTRNKTAFLETMLFSNKGKLFCTLLLKFPAMNLCDLSILVSASIVTLIQHSIAVIYIWVCLPFRTGCLLGILVANKPPLTNQNEIGNSLRVF